MTPKTAMKMDEQADPRNNTEAPEPELPESVLDAIAQAAIQDGIIRGDGVADFKQALLSAYRNDASEVLDGYTNPLTGIGDPLQDKTFGGRWNGPGFFVRYMSGNEAMDRWRGSDLGRRIVETIPAEMTRCGWKVSVQPEEGEFDSEPETEEQITDKRDARNLTFARLRRLWDGLGFKRDALPEEVKEHTPGVLHNENDGSSIIAAIEREQRALKLKERLRTALNYQRAYGGGAVLIGVDDGKKLVEPLDPADLNKITHLTAFRGGWDGELIAWSYYCDQRHPRYGDPMLYMLRNIGVPISAPPAPGSAVTTIPVNTSPSTNMLIDFVHESRLLIFPGVPVSTWARVQMRGWSDTIFTSVDEVLSQFNQTWSGISILMQEYSIPVQKVKGLSGMLASKNKEGLKFVMNRALAMKLGMSIAKTRMIDENESLDRMTVAMGGMGDVLMQMWYRLAAAARMPVSMLLGQVQGGLGDASKGDVLFFYDQIAGEQDDTLLPELERFTKLQFLARQGPTKGKIPKRWSVAMNPIRQMSKTEWAQYVKTILEGDKLLVEMTAATPEEVAGTRLSGSTFNDGPLIVDMKARRAMVASDQETAIGGDEGGAGSADPNVQQQALNGAQITALVNIVAQVSANTIPRDAALGIVMTAFQCNAEQAKAMLGSAGLGFEPTPEEPPAPPPGTVAPGAPPPAAAPPALVSHDAADFITKNGRTKVQTAVSIVIPFDRKTGKVWVGRRKDNGKLGFLSETAEPGEDPLATAVRGLWEEMGLHAIRTPQLIGTKVRGGPLAHVKLSIFRTIVEGQPTGENDPDQEFGAFEAFDLSDGQLPPELLNNLHHVPDVVGPMLRRRR